MFDWAEKKLETKKGKEKEIDTKRCVWLAGVNNGDECGARAEHRMWREGGVRVERTPPGVVSRCSTLQQHSSAPLSRFSCHETTILVETTKWRLLPSSSSSSPISSWPFPQVNFSNKTKQKQSWIHFECGGIDRCSWWKPFASCGTRHRYGTFFGQRDSRPWQNGTSDLSHPRTRQQQNGIWTIKMMSITITSSLHWLGVVQVINRLQKGGGREGV